MSNRSLPKQTNFQKEQKSKDVSVIGKKTFYVMLVSRDIMASYIWRKQHLEFICQTRFKSRLDPSPRFEEQAGRRRSRKECHKQGVSETHSSEDTELQGFLRLHLESLRLAVPFKKLPLPYQSEFKIITDKSNRGSLETVLRSSSIDRISFISSNVLASIEEKDPQSEAHRTPIIAVLAQNEVQSFA